MGGVFLADGTEVKVVTGVDDHSRFVCSRPWWSERPLGRCVGRSLTRCAATVYPTRC
jgi:hypothetical protein